MPHRSVAIANEFLKMPGALETVTQMQLQKLVYLAHGWNLVVNECRLVSDPIEAWTYGPVFRDLYDHTKFFGKEPIGRLITPDDSEAVRVFSKFLRNRQPPYQANVTDREKQVIQHVWNRYGALDAIRLSQLTHQRGTPWFDTFTQKGRDSVISDEIIRPHYVQLAERATQASG